MWDFCDSVCREFYFIFFLNTIIVVYTIVNLRGVINCVLLCNALYTYPEVYCEGCPYSWP